MSRSTRLAPVSKVVVLANCLLIVLVLFSSTSEYLDQNHMSGLIGTHFKMRVFVAENFWQLVGQCGIALVLLAGTAVELRRSRFAWLVNLGGPFFALILVSGQMLQHRNPEFSGEAEQLIIIVVMPLVAMVLLYSTIYYRQRKISADAFAPASEGVGQY